MTSSSPCIAYYSGLCLLAAASASVLDGGADPLRISLMAASCAAAANCNAVPPASYEAHARPLGAVAPLEQMPTQPPGPAKDDSPPWELLLVPSMQYHLC